MKNGGSGNVYNFLRVLAGFFCIQFILSGCAHDPFPRDAVGFVRPGETTRAELIENFSNPIYDFKDPHVIGYLKETIGGKAAHNTLNADPSSLLYQDDPGFSGRDTEVLCFLLDDKDRVIKFEKLYVDGRKQPTQAIKEWARGERHGN
jgi:hypothetical protein